MSLRETVNQKPGVFIGISAAIVLIAIVVMIHSMKSSSPAAVPILQTEAFFSDDDGKTFFADDVKNIPPFDHNGKKAYRAKVFVAKGSTQKFVGYLESYDEKSRKRIDDAINKDGLSPVQAMQGIDVLVKKPGAGKWVKVGTSQSPELQHIFEIVSPDGKKGQELSRVLPTIEDQKGS